MSEVFEKCAQARGSIPKDSRGFFLPHADLYVTVEDRPCMIHAISFCLLQGKINIKDLKVVKVREGEGGTVRLALENEADQSIAKKLLEK